MSWIKDNKFMVGLGGGSLLGIVLLYFAGAKGADQYEQSKGAFEAAYGEASGFVSSTLYPTAENRDGKKKAIDEYRRATESIQAAFEPFRPKEMKNISPQDFTNHLKATNDELRKAFEESATKVPDAFFCGFENYKAILARGNATGILDYQLTEIKNVIGQLAKSGVSELKNLHRPALPEEEGKDYKPQDADVARALPLEITFMGPEKSVRSFISSLGKMDGEYVVIRSIRVANAKKDPPRAADAKFDKPAAAVPAEGGNVFGGGFVLPGEEPKADAPKADAPKPKEEPAPAPAPANTSRILSQVLGNEEVQVFLRLDLMQFLPAKKLPN